MSNVLQFPCCDAQTKRIIEQLLRTELRAAHASEEILQLVLMRISKDLDTLEFREIKLTDSPILDAQEISSYLAELVGAFVRQLALAHLRAIT